MIYDHGVWELYVPDPFPAHLPLTALFLRNDAGSDWYEYLKRQFGKDTVKVTIMMQDGKWVGMAASKDVSRLYPAGMTVLEITDFDKGDPQAYFARRQYFPDTQTFGDKVI